jgi:hypothetical protein
MEVMSERVDGNTFSTAEYMDLGNADSNMSRDYMGSGLYQNFSPTLAISAQRLVISSDRKLAERIVNAGADADSNARGSSNVTTTNSIIEVWPQQLVRLGERNREVLIAQRMLQTGLDRERVAGEIELFLKLANCIEFAALELAVADGYLMLEMSARAGQDSERPRP